MNQKQRDNDLAAEFMRMIEARYENVGCGRPFKEAKGVCKEIARALRITTAQYQHASNYQQCDCLQERHAPNCATWNVKAA